MLNMPVKFWNGVGGGETSFIVVSQHLGWLSYPKSQAVPLNGYFLRLEIVEDAVEENMNNDMLELIIFLQCNGDLSEILGGIPMVTVS